MGVLSHLADDDEPYAYQRWHCSTCDGEPVEVQGTLRCETCGHLFDPSPSGTAARIPTCDSCEEPKDRCVCPAEEDE